MSPSLFAPTFAPEYVSELRVRQHCQLESIATYLDEHLREPLGGGLCGRAVGGTDAAGRCITGWVYGPSYSRTVLSLAPGADATPLTARSRASAATARSGLSSARSLGSARARSPGGAAAANDVTPQSSLYTVVRSAPFSASPTSARLPAVEPVSARGAPPASGRPLSAEFAYPAPVRSLRVDEMVSKADAAIARHQQRQRRLEREKERLRHAAPMEFRWRSE